MIDLHTHSYFSDGTDSPEELVQTAKAAGVEDRIGSIAVGKDADIVVFSGHPFHYLTKTRAVFINGRREE